MLVGCFGYDQENECEEKKVTPRSDWCISYSGFATDGKWDTRLEKRS